MHPIYLTQGETLPCAASFSAPAGAITIHHAGLPGYVAGRPLFYRDNVAESTICLGRVSGADPDRVDFAWSLPIALDGDGRLFQPARSVALPPHLRPLLHTEYRTGMVERPTAGGSALLVERQEVAELVRVRLPAPPSDVLERLLDFVRGLRGAGTNLLTLVDERRRVRRVALVDDTVELHGEQFRPGDPFDLLLRVDAEQQHA